MCALKQCRILNNHGYDTSVWSFNKGPLELEFVKSGTEVRYMDAFYLSDQLETLLDKFKKFDLVLANTIETATIADISQCVVPTVLYLHEAGLVQMFSESDCRYLYALKRAERVYSVSQYTRNYLYSHYSVESEVVQNCADGLETEINIMPTNGKMVKFLCLGSISDRKGIDTVISAFQNLGERYRSSCELHFAGPFENFKSINHALVNLIIENDNVYYHGVITDRRELYSLLGKMDVVVVDSRDDPCPLVVYEAAEAGRPVITSTNVGSNFLAENGGGWIIEPGNADALREVFETIMDNPEKLENMSEQVLKNYRTFASFEVYEKNILKLVLENLAPSLDFYRSEHTQKLAKLHLYAAKEENDALRQLVNRKDDNLKLRKWLFPFSILPHGSNIVLYGAGRVGRDFYRQLIDSKYCNIVSWVDKNAGQLHDEISDISCPENIAEIKFDYVVIATFSTGVSTDIFLKLLDMGVPRNKIIVPEFC